MPPKDSRPGNPLFAGVGDLCDELTSQVSADGAAVAVLTRRAHTRELAYATDALAVRLDELQYTLGEGPCLDAYLDDCPQFHPDLDDATQTSSRWPTFATEVTRLGVHSLFAFPIPGLGRPVRPSGVLELYRREAGELSETHLLAAANAATAIAHRMQTNWSEHAGRYGSTSEAIDAATNAGLGDAADPFTRSQIHVAAGIVAHQLGVHPDHAVDRLRAHAYASERRVSAVAADVIAQRLTLRD